MLDQGATAFAVVEFESVAEKRSEPRYSDIVDSAVITFRGRDYPVPVLDISSRGTQIECDIQPRLGESLIIQFDNCSRMQGFVRWAKEGRLGLRFGHEIVLC
jgi:hypothetical protein